MIEADASNVRGSGDIAITPDGKVLYTSHRLKNDGIAIFSVDSDGWVSKSGYQHTGIHPRNIMITPNGKFLLVACKDSHRVEIYEIDPRTGLLKNIHKDIHIHMPVCLKYIHNNY
jgi:6-phosphogluconolactonase (cycloisomerase 2 family)